MWAWSWKDCSKLRLRFRCRIETCEGQQDCSISLLKLQTRTTTCMAWNSNYSEEQSQDVSWAIDIEEKIFSCLLWLFVAVDTKKHLTHITYLATPTLGKVAPLSHVSRLLGLWHMNAVSTSVSTLSCQCLCPNFSVLIRTSVILD